MLTGTHAVTQTRHIGLSSRRFLNDLTVYGGHPNKNGGGVFSNQSRPQIGIVFAFVHDHGFTQIQGVHQAGPQYIGPVKFTRVHDAILLVFGKIKPILSSWLTANQGTVGVQHAFGVTGGARGVNQVGRVIGSRGMVAFAMADGGQLLA